MPAPRGKLTDAPELAAYVLAHAVGYAWGYGVNPMIFRSLAAQGYRTQLHWVGLGIGIATVAVVLLIFLLLRKAMAGPGAAAPPADKPAPPPTLCDTPEISAYLLAHGAGIAWGFFVTPLIFRALMANGPRNLMVVGLAISLAVSVAVLLIFLFLRKTMGRPS